MVGVRGPGCVSNSGVWLWALPATESALPGIHHALQKHKPELPGRDSVLPGTHCVCHAADSGLPGSACVLPGNDAALTLTDCVIKESR